MHATHVTLALLLVPALLLSAPDVAPAQDARLGPGTEPIRKVVTDYNRGLNSCNLDDIARVWESDGVFMPPNQPPAEGAEKLRAWYQDYCRRTAATLTFVAVEAQRIGDWGWLRVAATGSLRDRRTGTVTQQDNKSLFIVHRGADGTWRISRYAINSNQPAAGARRPE